MLLCLCMDETEQKLAEEALRIREKEYSLAIDNSGQMVYRYTVSDKTLDISPGAAALFGLPSRMENVPESLLATGFVAQESISALRDFYACIDRGGKTGSMTIRQRVQSGAYRWFEGRFSTIFNDAGAPVSAVILLEDVTEEREEHIVSALDRARLLAALRTAYPVAISVNFTRGEYKALSGSAFLSLPDAAEGRLNDLVTAGMARMQPEDAKEFQKRFSSEALLHSFSLGMDSVRTEYLQRTVDGAQHWVEAVALHVQNDFNSDVTGIVLCRIIDEQKTAEETLKRALDLTTGELSRQRQYQQILDESIPIGTALVRLDKAGTLLHVGGTMLSELGYTASEYEALQKQHLRDLVLEADYGTLFRDRRAEEPPYTKHFEQEFRVVKKDGSIRWMYEKGTLVTVDGGPAYILVCMDITRRKEMEEQLRISEEERTITMAQIGKTVCLYDVASRTLTMPEAYARKHGLPSVVPDIPRSVNDRGVLADEAGRLVFAAFYSAILRGEKTGDAEVRFQCADGTDCWERGEFVTIFDRDHRPVKAVIAVEDITLQRKREDENATLRENARVFRVVAAHSNRMIYRYDIAARTAYADTGADGKTDAAVFAENMPEYVIAKGLVLPESIGDLRQVFAEIYAGKAEGGAKVHMVTTGGKPRWLDLRYSLVRSGAHTPTSAVLSLQDITEEHERELAYERYRQTVGEGASKEAIVYFETDLTADIVEKQGGNIASLAFPQSGCHHEEAVGYGINNLVKKDDRARAWSFFSREHLITAFSDGTRNLSMDLPVDFPPGKDSWFRADVQMILDPYSDYIKAYTILRDVTEEKLAALDVKKQAETDGLTGIYNKITTETLVREKLADTPARPCALLIADLDSLKPINDSLGHAQGDRAIKSMAGALMAQFRRSDIIGRIGGDEFLAFLDGVGDEARLRGVMAAFMRQLATVRIGENDDVALCGSIGVATGVIGRDSFDELYRKADTALYHVKRNGKNDYAFYTPDMEETAYRYRGHTEASRWQADAFDHAELDRLLFAMSAVYPLVISANLTKNSYYMMRCDRFMTAVGADAGEYDQLIRDGAATYHPDDRQSFYAAFNRSSLLAAYARGQRVVCHTGRQLGDDCVYRRIRTDVIFTQSTPQGDVTEITLAREDEPGNGNK